VSTFPLPGANWTYLHGLTLKATTGPAGFALQNGTPGILTWTAPADGQLHRFLITSGLDVTSVATGGAIAVSFTLPDGTAVSNVTLFGGSQAAGTPNPGNSFLRTVKAGTTVTVTQTSALTAGAAVLWAEIWGL
jgi:hypothetical protein